MDRIRCLRLVFVAALAVPLLLLVAGCGSTTKAGARSVRVTERDFAIRAPKRIAAGDVDLVVDNDGPDAHELILVRLDGRPLPLRQDGLTVDEEVLERRTLGGLEPGNPGAMRHLRVHLTPGRYELFCNMYGHYRGGMRTQVVVG